MHAVTLLLLAALGQTATQPADQAPRRTSIRVTPPSTRPADEAAATRPAMRVAASATQPAESARGDVPATRPAGPTIDPADMIARLGPDFENSEMGQYLAKELSGEPIQIQVTADNKIVLIGNQRDIEILAKLIELLETQPGIQREFKVVSLKAGQATSLQPQIEKLWNEAKAGPTGQVLPEDKLTVIAEPRSNSLMIAATPDNIPLVEELIAQVDRGVEFKFTPILLQHIPANEAQQTLSTMLEAIRKQRGAPADLFTIQADPRTQTLLVSAPEADMETIRNMVALLDQPAVIPGREGRAGALKLGIFPLKRAIANDLAGAMEKMLAAPTGDATKGLQEQIRRLQVISARDGAKIPDLILEEPIRVLSDSGSNSLIVATTEANMTAVGGIIELLDSAPIADEMMVKIFPLNHADAESLMTGIKAIFSEGNRLPEQPGKTIPGRLPPGIPGEALGYNIAVNADTRTNTLIVAGHVEQILLVERIIASVDVPESANKFPPRLVKLENADVTRIADALQKLVDARAQLAEKQGPNAAMREKVVVIPDVRSNSLIIVAKDDNFGELESLARQLDGVEDDWLGQIRIIKLDKLAAPDLAEKVQDLWERRAQLRSEAGLPEDKPVIVTDSRSNSLVIASNPEDFKAIQNLIGELEKQPTNWPADIRKITLKHNSAAKLREAMQKLFDERIKMALGEGQTEQPSDRVFLQEDPLTNTLMVVSSEPQYQEILKLVEKLDVPPAVGGLIRMFPVRNQDVTKAADLLTELFDKGVVRPGATDESELPEWAKKVTVVADLRSSSLLISASPENFTIIESVLQDIDRVDVPLFQAEARFIPIKHKDVVSLGDQLEKVFEGMRDGVPSEQQDQLQLRVIPDPATGSLILAGPRYAMARAVELVDKMDQPGQGPSATTEVYRLKEASAAKLQPMLTDVFEKRFPSDSGERTPITLLADPASNSLIVTASSEDHAEVLGLLGKLDVPTPNAAQQIEIIPLRNAPPDMVAEGLRELMEKQQSQGTENTFGVVPHLPTKSLIIYAPPDMMRNIREIIARLDTLQPIDRLAMRVFRLENAKAEQLSELLGTFFEGAGAGTGQDVRQLLIDFSPVDRATGRPVINPVTGEKIIQTLIHQDITVTPDPYTNSLLVMAPEDSIDMMEMLVEMLDSVTPVTAIVRVFFLRNADASEMKDLLDELFQTGGQGGGAAGEERRQIVFAAEGAVPAVPGVPGGSGSSLDLAFSVDQRTNALIAAGSDSYLQIVEKLIFQLDYQDVEDRIVRVVRLRNATAGSVADTLQSYFEAEDRIAGEGLSDAESAQRRQQRQVTVQEAVQGGDSTTGESSVLLLSYSPRVESQIIGMINELDQAPPQVMIQVLMAEVTLDDRFEMGVEFAVQDLMFSENATEVNGIPQGSGFDYIGGTDLGAAGATPLGGVSFTVTGEDFNFLFRALQTAGRLEVLSRPSIMVQDGKEANIVIGEEVPTVTDVVISGNGLATPSVTYRDVGIKLNVTPIINPDGYVNLTILPEISSLAASSVSIGGGVNLPIITKRSADTSVTVKDGETIIIGGLITSREIESQNKVPLAGDIPVLGNLFRATVNTQTKTELLIVLTPHVIRTVEDARTMSVQLRDQTGLIDNIRHSPLMQSLQAQPESEFGPIDQLLPPVDGARGPGKALPSPTGVPYGPELEEFGPQTSTIIQTAPRQPVSVLPASVRK